MRVTFKYICALLAFSYSCTSFGQSPGVSHAGSALRVIESKSPPKVVEQRYREFLKSKGVEVFAVIDHAQAAESVKQSLPFHSVIIFGNPALGTGLMKKTPDLALDLPMKTLIRAHGSGTQIVYRDFKDVLSAAKANDAEIEKKVSSLLEATANHAAVGN